MRLNWKIEYFMVFAYNFDQMFLPNFDKKFGSHYLKIESPSKRQSIKDLTKKYYQDFEISRTHWKQVDNPELRCEPTRRTGNTTKCITKHLEGKIGCSMGLQDSNPKLKRFLYEKNSFNKIVKVSKLQTLIYRDGK